MGGAQSAAALLKVMEALTPTERPRKERRRRITRKRLFVSSPEEKQSIDPWSEEENKALVEFVLFHCDCTTWPSHGKKSKLVELICIV